MSVNIPTWTIKYQMPMKGYFTEESNLRKT